MEINKWHFTSLNIINLQIKENCEELNLNKQQKQ